MQKLIYYEVYVWFNISLIFFRKFCKTAKVFWMFNFFMFFFFTDKLQVLDRKRKQIIETSKTRWVKRLRLKPTIRIIFFSQQYLRMSWFFQQLMWWVSHGLWEKLQCKMDMGHRDQNKNTRDLFAANCSFEPILAFLVIFNCLQCLKQLVTILHTCSIWHNRFGNVRIEAIPIKYWWKI